MKLAKLLSSGRDISYVTFPDVILCNRRRQLKQSQWSNTTKPRSDYSWGLLRDHVRFDGDPSDCDRRATRRPPASHFTNIAQNLPSQTFSAISNRVVRSWQYTNQPLSVCLDAQGWVHIPFHCQTANSTLANCLLPIFFSLPLLNLPVSWDI